MRPYDRRWFHGARPGQFDRHQEFLKNLSEYRNGLIDVIEFLTKLALEAKAR